MSLLKMLLREKPCRMLILLTQPNQQWYLSKLAKESGSTYVHTTKTAARFAKEGLVKFETKGRTKTITLTEKGVLLAKTLEDLAKKLEAQPAPAPAPPQTEEKKPEDRAIV